MDDYAEAVPRHQFQQAYREDYDQGPGLVTCAVYFFALIFIGGIIMFLLLKLFWGIV